MHLSDTLHAHLEACQASEATPRIVWSGRQPLGLLSVADSVRPTADQAVRELKALGLDRVGILAGDHEQAARLVGEAVGATDVWAQMRHEDKLATIHQL